MAQILIKRSAVAAKVPATADISLGELAINTYDGKLYLKKSVSGVETVVQVGDPTTAPVQSVFGRTGRVVLQSSDVTTALGYTPVNTAGSTITGNLNFTEDARGITWSRNTDGASILFHSLTDQDPNTRLEFQVRDNGLEFFRWTRVRGDLATTYTDMELKNGNLSVLGTITAAGFSGPIDGTLTGNASTATTLQTTRSISATGDATWSVNFNGSANATAALTLSASGVTAGTYNSVTVDAKGRVTSASNISATTQLGFTPVNKAGDTMTGTLTATGFSGPLTGNATTATTLQTARTIAHSGDMTGSASFNGSANVTIPMTLAASGVTAGTYTKLTVDAKGRATAGTQLTAADVTTALGYTPSSNSEAGTPGGAATLDANGKLLSSQVPAIAISDTFVVASQAAMLALSGADVGDVAVRTDLSKSFILKSSGYATLANWQELLTPSDSVQSVAGRTGAVTLTVADISGTLPVAKGGTGVTTSTGSGSNVLSSSPTFTGTAAFESITASSITVTGGSMPMINPTTPKDGDIQVAAGPKISIYASGAWRQIFPAVYS